jgi:hypothetical protein
LTGSSSSSLAATSLFAGKNRQALMRRLQHVKSTARLRDSFEAVVGASRPVELTGGQRTALLLTLEGWSLDLDGYEAMPKGLIELRNALIDDLHDAEKRQAAT